MRRYVLQQPRVRLESDCPHYWAVESPKGPISVGVCKKCGEQKEFRNYLEGTSWDRDIPTLKFETPRPLVEEELAEN